MSGLAEFRRHRTTWGRRVLGTFVAAWLAMVLQPCAVAAGVDHDCPHCPPGENHEASHFEVSASADCVLGDQLSAETRSLQPKLKDTFDKVPVAAPTDARQFEEHASLNQRLPDPDVFLVPSGPSINILYCVHLK